MEPVCASTIRTIASAKGGLQIRDSIKVILEWYSLEIFGFIWAMTCDMKLDRAWFKFHKTGSLIYLLFDIGSCFEPTIEESGTLEEFVSLICHSSFKLRNMRNQMHTWIPSILFMQQVCHCSKPNRIKEIRCHDSCDPFTSD